MAAIAHALLTARSCEFGSIAGSLIGGTLLERLGTGSLFHGAAALILDAATVFIVGNRLAFLKPPAPAA